MKRISLKESQFQRLVEGIENYGDNSTPEFQNHDEVTLTSKIHDKDGDVKDSNPVKTDKISHSLSPQQWGAVGGRNSSNTI